MNDVIVNQPFLLSAPIRTCMARHHHNSVAEKHCLACNAWCCAQGGLAILENVLLIWEQYRTGALGRVNCTLGKNLGFRDFVKTCFDVRLCDTGVAGRILFFHARSLDPENHPIAVPSGGNYWEKRTALFENNPRLSRGCVFLSKPIGYTDSDDPDHSRRCLLHSPDLMERITAKPLGCVFFTCSRPRAFRMPGRALTRRFFILLVRHFPHSEKRYRILTAADSQTEFGLN